MSVKPSVRTSSPAGATDASPQATLTPAVRLQNALAELDSIHRRGFENLQDEDAIVSMELVGDTVLVKRDINYNLTAEDVAATAQALLTKHGLALPVVLQNTTERWEPAELPPPPSAVTGSQGRAASSSAGARTGAAGLVGLRAGLSVEEAMAAAISSALERTADQTGFGRVRVDQGTLVVEFTSDNAWWDTDQARLAGLVAALRTQGTVGAPVRDPSSLASDALSLSNSHYVLTTRVGDVRIRFSQQNSSGLE